MIRVCVEERDYGNELAILVLDERPGERYVARVGEGGRFEWELLPGEAVGTDVATLCINRRIVGEFFAALEGYRPRNETAESVLQDALIDTREVRDRLLTMLEGA